MNVYDIHIHIYIYTYVHIYMYIHIYYIYIYESMGTSGSSNGGSLVAFFRPYVVGRFHAEHHDHMTKVTGDHRISRANLQLNGSNITNVISIDGGVP